MPRQRTVHAERFMVVSGHPLATDSALDVLAQGGSLADAAVCASALLSVVATHANSVGGDGFVLLRFGGQVGGRIEGLNGSGPAPGTADAARFAGGIPAKGAIAAVVPGLPRMWGALHERHGRLPWSRLIEPAIAAAQAHTASVVLLRNLDAELSTVRADPGCSAIYVADGQPLAAGAMLKQPALARTLGTIAAHGAAGFYQGAVAQALVRAVGAAGGLISTTDLVAFRPEWVTPLSTSYRGLTVHGLPPNAYGALMLAQLNALAGLDPAQLAGDPVTCLDFEMRAAFAALALAKPRVFDSRTRAFDQDGLLGAAATLQLQAALHVHVPTVTPPSPGGTTGLVLADAASDDAIVMLQSNFQPFGCAFLDQDTGILLNNRMMCFSADPKDPNVVAPGKRPAHTHNPVLVTDAGRLRLAMATPGGISQTISCVQVMVNRLDRGWDLAQAIDAPRWSTDRFGAKVIETAFEDGVVAQLATKGHAVTRASGSNFFGSVKAIEQMPDGSLLGHADHRREATAGGL